MESEKQTGRTPKTTANYVEEVDPKLTAKFSFLTAKFSFFDRQIQFFWPPNSVFLCLSARARKKKGVRKKKKKHFLSRQPSPVKWTAKIRKNFILLSNQTEFCCPPNQYTRKAWYWFYAARNTRNTFSVSLISLSLCCSFVETKLIGRKV